MGYPTSFARSAEEAIKLLECDAPHDLLLLDLQLPMMGGMDLFEQVHQRWPGIQVIVLTGFGDLATARRAIHLDVVDFLAKPCPLHEIEAALERARRRIHGKDRLACETFLPPANASPAPSSCPMTLDEIEREQIRIALERNHGNRTATAAELGISRRTLHYRLQEYRQLGLGRDEMQVPRE
jgi:DNA-binding NtrC family response regulator